MHCDRDASPSTIRPEDFLEVTVMTRKSIVKVFSMSDIHADTKANSDYLSKLEKPEVNCFSVFICNGDLCTDILNLRKSFRILKDLYDEVCFVPGNHELWRRGSEDKGSIRKGNISYAPNSMVKFNEVISCAKGCGIRTGPVYVKSITSSGPSIRIYPLYSWYHSGFDTEKQLTHPLYKRYVELVPFDMVWMDFRQCQWPGSMVAHSDFASVTTNSIALASFFASINEVFLPTEAPDGDLQKADDISIPNGSYTPSDDDNAIIISFSHFVPRVELIPERRFILEPKLASVSGSNVLEAQIRRLKPDIHIYGHTHLPIDMTLEGIRYVQWPLGYAKEHEFNCKESKSHGPLLILDTSRDTGDKEMSGIKKPDMARVCLLPDDERSPTFHTFYSRYYREVSRTPEVTDELPHRLEQRLSKFLQLEEVDLI